MRKICVMALAILLCAMQASAAERPADFRGCAWGASVQQCSGLVPVPNSRMSATYYRPDDSLKIGMADVVSIAYYFEDDHLYSVGVAFKGEKNQFLLKDWLINKYGPGRQIGSRFGWMWKDFSISIAFPPAGDADSIGTLIYRYEPSSALKGVKEGGHFTAPASTEPEMILPARD